MMDEKTAEQTKANGASEPIRKQASLPLSRVKKVIKYDEEVHACSNQAAQLIAAATEMLLEQLVEKGYQNSVLEKRKGLQMKDLRKAVSRIDSLEFLVDLFETKQAHQRAANPVPNQKGSLDQMWQQHQTKDTTSNGQPGPQPD